ncbi:hypothetical protein M8J75_007938 [Diaphorina citri]|nr:hypothetical protein M8J75_007938 [Diaphorina citri]
MEESFFLILLCLVMLGGSYFAGLIPLVVSLSESKLQTVSVFGAGLLVGTALAVIIPEGVRSLLSAVEAPTVTTANIVNTNEIKEEAQNLHALIGITLVLGFVLMLLIDQISNIESGLGVSSAKITATLGLVVHSAVDGVALGAAATTTHTDVEMIVFIAIMLHKAPAAFGLVTFLLHEGVDRKRIRKHLLVFSLAAPTLALVTFFGIGKEGKETLSSVNGTGLAMLFSAGTFLYVATVHVLPELTSRCGGTLRMNQLFCLIVGIFLPSFLTLGHHH